MECCYILTIVVLIFCLLMLLYLNHSCPDISFAIHQCARYTVIPKQSHKNALKQIGQSLKGTLGKGLILQLSDKIKLAWYPDAFFAFFYGTMMINIKNDQHCVRSCTGYIICLLDCSVLWISKLQTEIVLSVMEAEYVSLSTLCWDLFPMIYLTKEICSSLSLQLNDEVNMHIKIH